MQMQQTDTTSERQDQDPGRAQPGKAGYLRGGDDRWNRAPEPIKEPGLCDRTRELLGYLETMEGLQSDIRAKLLGRVPTANGNHSDKRDHEPSLDELLATACTLAATLVGEQRTIFAHL